MKKVSIIIPCYNLKKDKDTCEGRVPFDVCMQSVLGQSMERQELEIILVNDASKDEGYTKNILCSYETNYPENILVVELNSNQRQGGARNIGLSYASGEYVAFLDADDWVEPDLYEKAYELASEKCADIVYFFHDAVKGELHVPMDDMNTPGGIYKIDSVDVRKQFLMAQIVDYRCTTKLYRRQLLLDTSVAFPHHMIYEEPLFTYPLMFYGTTYVVLPEILYHYRVNSNSTMNTSHDFMRLSNHPEVQLMLFQEMAERGLLDDYENEICFHFLHSYFLETLLFAANQKIRIPKAYFERMQRTVRTLLPDWRNNAYLQKKEYAAIKAILEQGLYEGMMENGIEAFCNKVQHFFQGL